MYRDSKKEAVDSYARKAMSELKSLLVGNSWPRCTSGVPEHRREHAVSTPESPDLQRFVVVEVSLHLYL